jgi:hypothetical protein
MGVAESTRKNSTDTSHPNPLPPAYRQAGKGRGEITFDKIADIERRKLWPRNSIKMISSRLIRKPTWLEIVSLSSIFQA